MRLSGSGGFPWRKAWQSTPVFLCGESLGQRSLVGYSPQGGKNWTLEQLSMYTHVVVNASIIHTWK